MEASLSCHPCKAGTFAPIPAMVECLSCDAVGGYSDHTGAIECEKCPPLSARPSGTPAKSIRECLCVVGAYNMDGKPGKECFACPKGAVCDGGLAPPVPIQGYWRFTDRDETFHECPRSDACLGVPADIQVRLADKYGNSTSYPAGCEVGYTGPLCTVWFVAAVLWCAVSL